MSLDGKVESIIGRPGPERALIFRCSFEWRGQPMFLLDLHGQLKLSDAVLSDNVYPKDFQYKMWGHPAKLEDRDSFPGQLVAPLTCTAIQYIEERRRGKNVGLRLDIRYQYQNILSPQTDDTTQKQVLIGTHVYWDESSVNLPAIPQSDWVVHLKQMDWDEIELYEISKLPLVEDEKLAQALKLLNEAQNALRSGDWQGVLAKCRQAFESAAKYQCEGDNLRVGFEALIAKAFPEHEAKHDVVNAVIDSLSKYFHRLGRHEQYPALHVSREEAEFGFTSTLGLFSLLSRRLSAQ